MSQSCLQILVKTWTQDAKTLHDYESLGHTEQKLQVTSTSYLAQRPLSNYLHIENSCSDRSLLKIHELDTEYILLPTSLQPVYLSLSQSKLNLNKGLKLNLGDEFKLGLVTLIIKELKLSPKEKTQVTEVVEAEVSVRGDLCCRICFTSNDTDFDPLISICSCQGSVSLTHFNCMKSWILSKAVTKRNTYVTSYIWEKLQCEICKDRLPFTFVHRKKSFDLISLPRPEGKFMIIEERRRNVFPYILHLVEPSDSPISIGRGIDNDIVINHSSISRNHAVIDIWQDFYIRDLKSKFGTLALVNKSILVNRNEVVPIQVDKSLLLISLKQYHKRCSSGICRKDSRVKPSVTLSGSFSRIDY